MLLKESTSKELLLKRPLAGVEANGWLLAKGNRSSSGPLKAFLGAPLSSNRLSEDLFLVLPNEGQPRKGEGFLLAFSACCCCCFCFFPDPFGLPIMNKTRHVILAQIMKHVH